MKKFIKVILILFAFSFFLTHFAVVSAIGFDAEESFDSVFVVTTDTAIGSGFALGPQTIITNAHVVKGYSSAQIESYDGTFHSSEVYLINDDLDIAVLYVKTGNFDALPLGDDDDIKIGDDVFAIGAPAGMNFTLTKGTVSSNNRVINKEEYIQIDAALNSGNSGGPLLDNSGKLIGMNTMKISNSEGLGLAIPVNTIIEYIRGNGIEISENQVLLPSGNTVTDNKIDNAHAMQSEKKSETDDKTTKKGINVVVTLLCISVILNIVLILITLQCLQIKKKKTIESSERTDFEIDIWE